MHVQRAQTFEQAAGRVQGISLWQLFVWLSSAGIVCAWVRAWGSGGDLLVVAAGAAWHGAVRGLCWSDFHRGSRVDVAWESVCHVACLGLLANMMVYAVLAWSSI